MGITSQAQNAMKAAFRLAGDAKTSIILKTSTSSFDPVTGTTSKSWAEETAQGILTAYISVLTNEPVAIIKNMESVDRSTAQSIATFFL